MKQQRSKSASRISNSFSISLLACVEFEEDDPYHCATAGSIEDAQKIIESGSEHIRDTEHQKIPFMVIVGKNEVIQEKVAVRKHGTGNIGSLTIEELATLLSRET